jgi:hypothetical protein
LGKWSTNLEINKYHIISRYCKIADEQDKGQGWKSRIVKNVSRVTEVAGVG